MVHVFALLFMKKTPIYFTMNVNERNSSFFLIGESTVNYSKVKFASKRLVDITLAEKYES